MKRSAPDSRPYAPDDLETLVAIERTSFPSAWSRDMLVGWLRDPAVACRVFEMDGKVSGFLMIRNESRAFHILNLAVHPDHRRRGIALFALALLDEEARERGIERSFLEVREENLSAQLLYRKAGYQAVEIVSGYYGGVDAYRMEKRYTV